MGGSDLTVLVVDDDFRVAELHASVVAAVAGFRVAAVAGTVAAARAAVREAPVDLALVDVYLPDGSGIDLIRELDCDAFVLGAAAEGTTVRAALAAGASGYLVKPFPNTELARRLSAYAQYRRLVAGAELTQAEIDSALAALRPAPSGAGDRAPRSVTKELVLQALSSSNTPMSAGEVAATIGVSRATAQRYLAALVTKGQLRMQLRYGSTGRPEQEYRLPPG
ncbi:MULTISPECIES: response regulator [Rhodococcus]|uniref:Transcriptional regulatory protein n=1 Tax=Rhodococcus aetherivorans TaxID=191292 RepID=A0ABQ0YM65_9NOCA|nr:MULTISPECIES: response regulator [Rhodococcus]ETT26084.1 response regulator receiver and unknown domain protein [Rhodococcus rhodochrous ATCC 21198]NCL76823.1 Transcriptional regulatory protein CitT [Rhodococcus sp. YH1]AKE88872.1 response regulator receiver protein [Rhodococcus aetherivorans]KDE15068.1 response regulator receiver protein [Rhodococcus aetherivorans]MBC2591451.1 response regulator [Rhodococcus aetherivorans]